MKALVVYESSYGNTHLIADAIGEGRGIAHTVTVVPIGKATKELVNPRLDASALLTGRASKGINKQLRRHGFREIAEPMSFLVTKESQLATGQQDAARGWGQRLGALLTQQANPSRAN